MGGISCLAIESRNAACWHVESGWSRLLICMFEKLCFHQPRAHMSPSKFLLVPLLVLIMNMHQTQSVVRNKPVGAMCLAARHPGSGWDGVCHQHDVMHVHAIKACYDMCRCTCCLWLPAFCPHSPHSGLAQTAAQYFASAKEPGSGGLQRRSCFEKRAKLG